MMPVIVRKALIGAAIGVVACVLASLALRTRFFDSLENVSYDLRARASAVPTSPASPVVIVEINDSSIRALEPVVGRWPWPRFVHASAIDYLKRAGAKVIAYDVLFLDREGRSTVAINGREISGDESDQALVDSVRRAGNVVLLADATTNPLAGAASDEIVRTTALPGVNYHPGDGFLERGFVRRPFQDLERAAAGLGHNYFAKDTNTDSARRMLPFIDSHAIAIPSLGLAGALAYRGWQDADVKREGRAMRLGDERMPILTAPVVETGEPSIQTLLRFTAPRVDTDHVRSIFPTYSFFDVVLSEDNVESGKPPAIPASAFAGKLVFVGTTAAGLYDRYSSPFDGGIAGVELHATLADDVIANRFMRRAPAGVDIAWTLALATVGGVAAVCLPVSMAVVATVLTAAVYVRWLVHEVALGVWIAAVMPALAASLALFGGVAWRYFVEDREKRRIRHLFGRYVSGDVIRELLSNPALATLGGERRDMTVLFSDIRGFTTKSEASTPEGVVAQLNEYFGAMVEVLFRHQGTLDKFVGDMVMGLFGAPVPDPLHADHAVAAALEMIERLETLNVRWRQEGRPELNIGIGINSGEMIAGNIGAETAMSYTVIGDAVNLGSRLESLNKEYGTRILISDATRRRLTLPVETRLIGDVTVKGKTQAVAVFEVVAAKESAQ